jgi:hypothetical protein
MKSFGDTKDVFDNSDYIWPVALASIAGLVCVAGLGVGSLWKYPAAAGDQFGSTLMFGFGFLLVCCSLGYVGCAMILAMLITDRIAWQNKYGRVALTNPPYWGNRYTGKTR